TRRCSGPRSHSVFAAPVATARPLSFIVRPQRCSMFRILEEPLPVDSCLGCWAKHMGRFSQVAGHTSFGDVFLLDPDSGQYAVLCPFTGERFPTNCHDRETFLNGFLADPGIIERFARPADVTVLRERVGPLGNEEVYIPCPYPFLGGSG